MLLDDARYDVLIVGYGPSGATAANLLGQRGHRVAVVDQLDGIYDKPRAITADQEVMRVFQECGLADAIAPHTVPHPGTDFVGIEGQVIKRFYPQPPPHQLGWEPTFMFLQPQLEAALRDGVQRFSNVTGFPGHAFTGMVQADDGVTVDIHALHDGVTRRLHARYVIGCDGGKSTMRRLLSVGVEDLAFDQWWLVIDAHVAEDLPLPPRMVQYCRPARPGTYVVGPGALRRWEIRMLPGERPEDFEDEAQVRKVLATFVDVTRIRLWRIAIYRFHALVVERWRDRRVFLMGDAAHQMPPFLGQGICAGVRDAANLAWKLDGVLRGIFPDALLDTYGEERKPHVRTVVHHAKNFGLIIGELDMDAARERDRRLAEELASGRAETVRQKFIPGLSCGLIDGDSSPSDGAGALFVQPWVYKLNGDLARLDDLTGPRFLVMAGDAQAVGWLDPGTLLRWHQLDGLLAVIGVAAPDSGGNSNDCLHLVERDTVFAQWLAGLGARAAVVRPDHYVYGIARDAQELNRLVGALCDRLGNGIPAARTQG